MDQTVYNLMSDNFNKFIFQSKLGISQFTDIQNLQKERKIWDLKISENSFGIPNFNPLMKITPLRNLIEYKYSNFFNDSQIDKIIEFLDPKLVLRAIIKDGSTSHLLYGGKSYLKKLGLIMPVMIYLSKTHLILIKITKIKMNGFPYQKLSLDKDQDSQTPSNMIQVIELSTVDKISQKIFLHQEISLLFSFTNNTLMTIVFNKPKYLDLFLVALNKVDIKIKPNQEKIEVKNLLNRFQSEEISVFEFLLRVNFLASRTTQDLSQYPIFPWVSLSIFEDSPPPNSIEHQFRDLSLPSGIMSKFIFNQSPK